MRLEFLQNINEFEEHAVRLSDFDSAQAEKFRQIINNLIMDHKIPVDLTTFDFIEPVRCRLVLRVSEEDIGIETTDKRDFFCDLTLESYKNMSKLLEPFCNRESKGYQWLYDVDTPIDFLFSSGGKW